MQYTRMEKRLMCEINVVPYIDVMLVLLIIFMITAPLITQGVRIDLPEAPSEVIPSSENEPVIVTVDAEGRTYIDYGEDPEEPIAAEELVTRVTALLKYQPDTQFLVKGDRGVAYGRVIEVMALLQGAGIGSVGLITEPPRT